MIFIVLSVYDERDYFEFPIVNFPVLGSDVPILSSYGSVFIHFAMCRISISDLYSKIYESLLNCWRMVTDITSFVKRLHFFSDPTLNFNLYQNFVLYCLGQGQVTFQ